MLKLDFPEDPTRLEYTLIQGFAATHEAAIDNAIAKGLEYHQRALELIRLFESRIKCSRQG